MSRPAYGTRAAPAGPSQPERWSSAGTPGELPDVPATQASTLQYYGPGGQPVGAPPANGGGGGETVLPPSAGAGHDALPPASAGSSSGSAAAAASSAPSPTLVNGGESCGSLNIGRSEVKLVSVGTGSYAVGEGSWVKLHVDDAGRVTVTSSFMVEAAIVAGGPSANLYQLSGVTSVAGLDAPFDAAAQKTFSVKHLLLCSK